LKKQGFSCEILRNSPLDLRQTLLKSIGGTLIFELDSPGLMTIKEQLNVASFLLKTLGINWQVGA
jgi:hypothetical protein